MKKESKIEIARLLYLTTEKSQREIAAIVGWTEKQMTEAKQKNGWEAMRDNKGFSKQQIISLLHDQALKIIDSAKESEGVLGARQIDSIAKICASVERLESKASIETFIEVFSEFNKWLVGQDIEFAKKNNEYQDRFIITKIPK
jgi:hypothetical protein